MSTAKSSNPFHGWNYFDQLGESSFMPNYYQQEMESTTNTFRSLSPKLYQQQKTTDYFFETDPELSADDSDALYEATLLNSDYFTEKSVIVPPTTTTNSVDRLRQLLSHLHPNYSPLAQVLSESPSVRSQFSTSTPPLASTAATATAATATATATATVPMVMAFSMSDSRDIKGKGKGKFKPTM